MRLLDSFLIICAFVVLCTQCSEDKNIVRARLESCPSCSLNRLTEVKQFAYGDLPKYNVEFKKIHGAPPELVFLNENDEVVERHPLSRLNRQECNDLLQSKGFKPNEINKEL